MTSKKRTVIISAVLTVIGIVIFTILQLRLYIHFTFFTDFTVKIITDLSLWWHHIWQVSECNNKELLSDFRGYGITISSGIFTSAFVTFLIARGDYSYERRKSLENMFSAAEELQRAFMKIKYIFPDEPYKLVRDLLGEIDSNESSEKNNQYFREQFKSVEDPERAKEMYDAYYSPISHDAEIKFKEYLWKQTKDDVKELFTTPESKEEYLDKECRKKIEKYNQELDDTMKSYITFKDVRTKEITSAYGCLDFVFANKSIRKHIFEKLYEKQIKQVKKIKSRISYFEAYFADNGANKSLLFDWVWELQNSLVSENENAYYRQYQYDIDCEIVQILVYTYGKVNPEEFPDKKHYLITTKPSCMERIMQTQSEE